MRELTRLVLDTNLLVSWFLMADSTSGRAARRASESGVLLASEASLNELAEVLGRPKFDRYAPLEDRLQFIRLIGRAAEIVPIVQKAQVCRDPKDDKFLELALNGGAELILTGDRDLLVLHPFRGVTIQSPADYLTSS